MKGQENISKYIIKSIYAQYMLLLFNCVFLYKYEWQEHKLVDRIFKYQLNVSQPIKSYFTYYKIPT